MNRDFTEILLSLPGILIGLIIHEFCHALAADKLGDQTAREEGRLTLNPVRHIDPIGFFFIMIAGFGWARPVHFNPNRLRKPGRDEMIIALAGPLSNLAVALILSVVLKLVLLAPLQGGGPVIAYALTIIFAAIQINYGLCVFNLLPIPPLDGSHIMFQALRLKPETEAALYRFGMLGLFVILMIGSATGNNLLPIGAFVDSINKVVFSWLGIS